MSNMKLKGLLAGASLAATLAFAMPASAATVFCPGTDANTDREFSITSDPAATCLAFGPGNINGSDNDDFLSAFSDYTLIDKSDDDDKGIPGYTGLSGDLGSGTSGTISLTYPTAAQSPTEQEYFDFAVGFKSGQGQLDPDWAVFGLPSGLASFDWSISSQSLSHTNLYAKLRDIDDDGDVTLPGVPLPAGLPLVLTGLGVFGAFRLRKRKAV